MDREEWDGEFDLEAIQARQDALEAELAAGLEQPLAGGTAAGLGAKPTAVPEQPLAGGTAAGPERTGAEPAQAEKAKKVPEPATSPEQPPAGGTAAGPETAGEEPGQTGKGPAPASASPPYPETDWEAILEAVLFTMGRPVELSQLAEAIGQDVETARRVAENLSRRYEEENRGMQVIRLEDSYQLCTRGKFYENLIRVAAAPKRYALTDVVLETLAIIAYKQPVTRLEIEKIRGVNSDHAVSRLVGYGLVEEIGRLDAPGRPALFATTEEFLRRFGIGSRDNLPDMDPVRAEEIRSEVEEELQVDLDELEEEAAGGPAPEDQRPEAGGPIPEE